MLSTTEVAPTQYNSRTADKFVLRLPDGMRDRISLAAEKSYRSMNGEIIARIANSLDLEARYEEMRKMNQILMIRLELLERTAGA